VDGQVIELAGRLIPNRRADDPAGPLGDPIQSVVRLAER
jgi:hypothetical protein